MNHTRTYLLTLFGLVAVSLLCVMSLNWYVDPFYAFGRTPYEGIFVSGEREMKDTILRQRRNAAIIVGTSKVAHINVSEIDAVPMVNVGVSNLLPEEMLPFIEAYAAGRPVVIIGLDFFTFSEAYDNFIETPSVVPTRDIRWHMRNLFGWGVLKASVNTLAAVARGEEPSHWLHGSRNTCGVDRSDAALKEWDSASVVERHLKRRYSRYIYSERRIEALRKIKRFLETSNTPYIVFISPEHPDVLAGIPDSAAAKFLPRFKSEVKAIFPDSVDLMASPFNSRDDFYKLDAVHYRPEIGRRLVNMLLCRKGFQAACKEDSGVPSCAARR